MSIPDNISFVNKKNKKINTPRRKKSPANKAPYSPGVIYVIGIPKYGTIGA
jgi:hypothetical protein